jgi:hypothetical protein
MMCFQPRRHSAKYLLEGLNREIPELHNILSSTPSISIVDVINYCQPFGVIVKYGKATYIGENSLLVRDTSSGVCKIHKISGNGVNRRVCNTFEIIHPVVADWFMDSPPPVFYVL